MDYESLSGRYDENQDRVIEGNKVKGFVTSKQAAILINAAIDDLEHQRRELARAYSAVEGGTDIEHEVGESLTQVRKSIVRMRKAVGILAQTKLPLN